MPPAPTRIVRVCPATWPMTTAVAAEAIPVAIVRGAAYDRDEDAGAGMLLRPAAEDLFP